MIDYTDFGSQTMAPGEEDVRKRRLATQPLAQPTITPPAIPQQPPAPTQAPSVREGAKQGSTSSPAPAPAQGQTFAQLQAAGIARPAPPPLPVAQSYPATAMPSAQTTQPKEYSTTGGISVQATPQEASHFGANVDKPADLRELYNAMESYNSTAPNYGRNPAQVVAAYRSGDPQLQALARQAISQLDPESAYQVLNDQEFESIYGVPKLATQLGLRQTQADELSRFGKAISGDSYTNGPLSDPFARAWSGALGYTPEQATQMEDQWDQATAGASWRQQQLANGATDGRPSTPISGGSITNPNAPGGLSGVGGGNGSPLGGSIEQVLRQLLANPTAYGTDAMQREYEAGGRQIDDDFALQTKALNEEMARRGLYDSSIAAGNLSDLNIGKRSAQIELMDSLLGKRADAQDNGIRSALSAAMGYDSDLRGFGENQRQFNESLGQRKTEFQSDDQFRQQQALDDYLRVWYQLFGGAGI